MKPIVFFRKAHKWLGLLIGLQIFFWVAGGLVMSFLPIDEVHGDHLRNAPKPVTLNNESLQGISRLIQKNQISATEIIVKSIVGITVLELTDQEQKKHYFDLHHENRLKPIDAIRAKELAQSFYAGNGNIQSIEKVEQHSNEYRKALPAWQVNFDDKESTALYLNAASGELESVRNSQWRLFDFVWMLHIMDYKNRTDFNHPLLIGVAFLALIMVLTGIYLVFKTFRKRDFGVNK